MSTATIVPNVLPVKSHTERPGMGHYITIDCPAGWDDVKKICKKVLEFEGRNYTFTGWNSDRNEAFFRESFEFATIKRK